jgi:arginyl-tRNA synthetase
MKLTSIISKGLASAISELYNIEFPESEFQIQETRKEFEGDITIVVFPLLKVSRKSPEITANELGKYLNNNIKIVEKFNVIKGF